MKKEKTLKELKEVAIEKELNKFTLIINEKEVDFDLNKITANDYLKYYDLLKSNDMTQAVFCLADASADLSNLTTKERISIYVPFVGYIQPLITYFDINIQKNKVVIKDPHLDKEYEVVLTKEISLKDSYKIMNLMQSQKEIEVGQFIFLNYTDILVGELITENPLLYATYCLAAMRLFEMDEVAVKKN